MGGTVRGLSPWAPVFCPGITPGSVAAVVGGSGAADGVADGAGGVVTVSATG